MSNLGISQGLYDWYVKTYNIGYDNLTKDKAVHIAVELVQMGCRTWYHSNCWTRGNMEGPYYSMTDLYLEEMKKRINNNESL